MKFDIERMERELQADRERVAALQAQFEANEAAFSAAVKQAFDELSAPWIALAAYIRATSEVGERR